MTDTSNLGLPCIEAAQAQKHVTHNEALRILDSIVQLAVLDRDLNAPPPSPSEGERWIVKASPAPTGDWAGHGDQVAAWQDGGWQFSTPHVGWVAYVVDEGTMVAWNGTAWGDFFSIVTAIQNLALLGIGTTADATNPFSAKLNNVLWVAKTVAEGGDGDLRSKLSKESASKTLSYLFQDNFSGRAEIGLTGDDDFHFKTSPDGSTWTDALVLDKSTGAARLNSAVFLTGDLSPSQITADQNDYNPAGLSGASVLRLTTDALRKITGLQGGADGRLVSVVNAGSNPLVLANASASSSAANRFDIGADLVMAPSEGAVLLYDPTSSRWRLLSPRANVRERLTASRNYYVRTDGSDSNSGLANTASGAFLTIQKAVDTAAALDLSIYAVTINVADGTYTGAIVLKSYVGVGPIAIVGNAGTPANVVISTTGATCITGSQVRGPYSINGLKLVANTPGYNGVTLSQGTQLTYSNIDFGAANIQLSVTMNATAVAAGNSTISGNANIHWYVTSGGMIQDAGKTITLSGTPAFAQAFAWAQQHGRTVVNANTFSGSATGTRYYADTLALIDTVGGGATYLPGNAAGSTATGAVYQ